MGLFGVGPVDLVDDVVPVDAGGVVGVGGVLGLELLRELGVQERGHRRLEFAFDGFEVVQMLRSTRSDGLILHWFSGEVDQLPELLDLGCHFSVNSAVRRQILDALPIESLLPETDFPVARRRTGSRPGDTESIERILSEVHGVRPEDIRRQFYRNLRRIAVRSGAIDRIPPSLADLLLVA
jgi:hypothetical protein